VGYLEATVLGIVQGLTEFLPISSSAHLRILGDLFGWGDPGAAFTAIVQLGTEAAVITYFAKDIWRIVSKWVRALLWRSSVGQSDPDVRMGWVVIVGTVPIGVLGLLFQDDIESELRNLHLTAFVLAAFALVLGVVGFDDLRADFLVDGLDGALNTLAEVAGCVAVTAFDGLEGASRRAGGHAGTGARAILELDLDLDGRVSAGIENFAGVKINNDGHSHSFCLSARRRRPPRLGKHP